MYNKIKVISFATGDYIESQNKLKNHLTKIGIDNQINLTDKDLSDEFIKKNSLILKEKRGYGYWIWKPFIILEQLKKINSDEIILYIDCTDYPSTSFFDLIIKHFETEEILLINRGGFIHSEWTKRDCFILMNCDDKECHKLLQLDAGVIGVKKNQLCLDLLNDWLSFMKNNHILDDSPNLLGLPNLINFKEHRHDQSILTNLSYLKKIKSINIGGTTILFNHNQPRR